MSYLKRSFYRFVFVLGIAGPLLGIAGRWHWFLDIFSHFIVQFTVVLIVCMAILALGRKIRRLFASSLVLLYCAVQILPYLPIAFEKTAVAQPAYPFSIMHANVLATNRAHENVLKTIQAEQPDAVVLTEINDTWRERLSEVLAAHYEFRASATGIDDTGLLFFSKFPIVSFEKQFIGSKQVPTARSVVLYDGEEITIWATHPRPPVGDRLWRLRNEQLSKVSELVAREENPTILVGDLNTSPWSRWFGVLLGKKLVDSARGQGLSPTWPSVFSIWMRVPIDHVLHSREFTVVDRRVLGDIGSDHFPVYVEFERN